MRPLSLGDGRSRSAGPADDRTGRCAQCLVAGHPHGRTLAHDLGEAGYVVVSGLARGVDAAAHLAALPIGTIAVQAGGVDIMYPAENAELAEDIAKQGLRLSEQPMGLQPMARHFPHRNRIISGLARATVVVEAAAKSGSLITARDALDQGRDVLAVPGHPLDARASGCNMLIRDGATLVRNAADVLEAIGPCRRAPQLPLEPRPATATKPRRTCAKPQACICRSCTGSAPPRRRGPADPRPASSLRSARPGSG